MSGSVQGALPDRIAGRYRVQGVIGRGGVAIVYRVTDSSTDRVLALKQLAMPRDQEEYADTAALFESEYFTLRQLSHPRIIEVYEYGLDEAGPFYTMELLDGGDLRERARAPLPWREACALLADVSSSLALLHSRGLLHRDVSPRNVRCTKDGRAKLIDFGAMVPIGPCRSIVGTPPFAPPEVVQRGMLDGRSDVFSLGATLYSALTGELAYPARLFRDLPACWRARPKPPSSRAPEIPSALDALVMSMISVDPAARPRSAAEVMQRLAAIAELAHDETEEVSQAYLSAPVLVGRRAQLQRFHKRLVRAMRGRGGALLIGGAAGTGRSRMLDACALDAQVHGATVLRAGARGGKASPFAIARALIEQLIEAHPELAAESARALEPSPFVPSADALRLKDLRAHATDAQVQSQLCAWFARVCRSARVVVAVDDVHRADAASAALLAGLAEVGATCRLLVVATLPEDAELSAAAPQALELLANGAARLELTALSAAAMASLLQSVFGDVPNLKSVGDAIAQLSRGNPRDCMELAQHLVDTHVVRYERGTWWLPAQLDPAALPRSLEDAFARRIAALGPDALWLAECQALAQFDRFERADYAALLPGRDAASLDAAISELVSHQVVASDGIVFALAHGGFRSVLAAALDAEAVLARHRALARMCEQRGKPALVIVHHEFAGGLDERALDRLNTFLAGLVSIEAVTRDSPLLMRELAALFERALDTAERLQRRPREVYTFRRYVASYSVSTEDRLYFRTAPELLRRLKLDSGLDDYHALDPELPSNDRLMRALTQAAERHKATPKAERVFPPDEAIRLLVLLVGVSIAIGARTLNEPLLESLPDLIEPFEALSPVISAIRKNAIGTRDATVRLQYDRARACWTEVWNDLTIAAVPPGVDPMYIEIMRNAVAFALASVEAQRGLSSALQWVTQLEGDALQGVSVRHLRRIIRLQQGDWEGAERHRRDAELFAVQTQMRPMFTFSHHFDLQVGAFASDLATLERAHHEIVRLAHEHVGWIPLRDLAEGCVRRVRGDLAGARVCLERCLAFCESGSEPGYRFLMAWRGAATAYVDLLVELGEPEAARAFGLRAIARSVELDADTAEYDIARPLAIAEAKLRDYEQAEERLRVLLAHQLGAGISGVQIGATYEALARIAIWKGDRAAFETHAQMVASQYRRGEGSALGVRYDRLLAEAERSGTIASAREARSTIAYGTVTGSRPKPHNLVAKIMRGADTRGERTQRALRLLCEAKSASAGHLFLLGDGRLVHAASLGVAAAPPGLAPALHAYLDAEAKSDMTATIVITNRSSTLSTTCWTDAQGIVYRAIPLSSTIDGVTTYAGIAGLVLDAQSPDQSGVAQLIAALAEHLIAAGDAHPMGAAL